MPHSRASASEKLLRLREKRQRSLSAKSIAEKFNQKQSHFARRFEEDQVRQMQLHHSSETLDTMPYTGVNQSIISRRGASAWESATAGRPTRSPVSLENIPPLSMTAYKADTTSQQNGNLVGITTTSTAVFGLPDSLHRTLNAKREDKAQKAQLQRAGHSTRSTRRTERFNLNATPASDDNTHAFGHDEDGMKGALRLGSGLLGTVHAQGEGNLGLDSMLDGAHTDEHEAGMRKMTRAERFREVITNSKKNRAQTQRERADRDVETKALDEEINALMHLLPRRSKEQEEREAFERAGTAEVRALLQAYKKDHVAKQLTLKACGEFVVTPLVPNADANSDKRNQPIAQSSEEKTKQSKKGGAGTHEAGNDFLDEKDRELLKKIRAGALNPTKGVETSENLPVGDITGQTTPMTNPVCQGEKEDDFDRMMNLMRLDTRRAHATERTLTEEEKAELQVQQALLEMDRHAPPTLDLQEQEQKQLTRSEWIQQGGDKVFHMDDDEGGLDENDLDIPSSYEGDSQAGGEEVESAEEEGQDEDTSVEKKSGKSDEVVFGSHILDHIMSKLEALATPAADAKSPIVNRDEPENHQNAGDTSQGQRCATVVEAPSALAKAYAQILSQLHEHARRHVLEVANAFRDILIEAERSFLRGQRCTLSRPLLLFLLTITKIFPMSDYRHQVVTPFYIFMCSTLMQMKLKNLESVHSYVGLNAILVQGLQSSKVKFAGEAVVAALNVIALQLPRTVLEPAKHQGLMLPLPLVERSEAAILTDALREAKLSSTEQAAGSASAEAPIQWNLLATHHDAKHLLLCAYRQLDVLAELYRGMAAFPAIFCAPFDALDRLLRKHHPAFHHDSSDANLAKSNTDTSEWVRVLRAHTAVASKLANYSASAEQHRTPLALRTFRVRPIRQFEPLLAEREENALKSEIRLIKREVREDKKRVIRHVAAEATVLRRAQEKEQSILEAQRERKYNQVMGELQAQQHMMKTVDAIMAKGRSRPKKGISAAPKAPPGGANESDLT